MKINKINKHLARLTKIKRENSQVTKIVGVRGMGTLLLTLWKFLKRIIGEFCEQLYTKTLDKLDEMEKVPGNIQTSKTGSRTHRKFEQTYDK